MFDLDKALAEWKKSLRKHESFEDGTVMELESHLLDEFDKQKQNGLADEDAFSEAVKKIGRPEDVGGEYFKDSKRSRWAIPSWQKPRFSPGLLPNYLKMAWRRIVRQKGYSLINIFGLAVGLACCLLIAGYVGHEFCFEQTHPKRDRIFRVWGGGKVGGDIVNYAGIGGPLGPAAAAAIPEIETAVRLRNYDYFFSQVGASRFTEERIFFVDPGLFSMFHCQLVRGDPQRALTAPNLVVIDEPTARRYFGDQDPLGRTIRLSLDQEVDLQVSGVFRRLPSNTIVRSSLFASISTLERQASKEFSEWSGYGAFHTFLLLRPQANAQAVQAKFNALDKQHGGDGSSFHLQPLSRTHFDTLNICNDLDIAGNRQQVAVFAIIAGLILLVAAINFINLSTARAAARANPVDSLRYE